MLRVATLADGDAIAALAREAYGKYVAIIRAMPMPMGADYNALIAKETVLVLDGPDGIDASLVLMRRDDHLLLWSIAVATRRQGEGLGRRLMDYCEEHARAYGAPEIRLFTNALMAANRAWYQRLGYRETGEEQIGDKRIVHMVKRLG